MVYNHHILSFCNSVHSPLYQMVSQHYLWLCENGDCSPLVNLSFPSPFSTCLIVNNHHCIWSGFSALPFTIWNWWALTIICKMVSQHYSSLYENGDYSPFAEHGFQSPFVNVFKWWALTIRYKIVSQHHLPMGQNGDYSPFCMNGFWAPKSPHWEWWLYTTHTV